MDRILSEMTFHDEQARQRNRARVALAFDDADYLDHETWIRPAFLELGDLSGLRVLDFGCGHGMAAVVLARAGARVTAFDLSGGYVQEARARAEANSARIDFLQANGEALPFADGSFDRVWGCAVLHHLDLQRAGAELHRVLTPGGKAVFCEPWGGNPVLNFARRRLPYPGKHRTRDEEPLAIAQVRELQQAFPGLGLRGFQLVSMVRRVLRDRRLRTSLDWCDRMLLERVPALEKFCRYMVLTLQRHG